ncbi:MAG: metal-dependent hydrolase [Desulfurococcales archaeon]|nr:metal-dependent hydrolase [Desulfurococcales archaeon]
MARIRYLGHSSFEIRILNKEGVEKRILIDPFITGNPASPVKLDELTGVDLVVVTHGHGDHLGDAISILKKNPNAKVVGIFELANYVAEQIGDSSRAIGGNMGGPMLVDGLKIALTPAMHSSPYGAPTGVVIISEREGVSIYHAGDTGIFATMQLIGEIYKPTVALLPIGGHFTMDPVEAAKAVELIKPKYAIPMHYGTFPVLYGTPEEFKRLVEEKGLPTKVVILKPGEEFEVKG